MQNIRLGPCDRARALVVWSVWRLKRDNRLVGPALGNWVAECLAGGDVGGVASYCVVNQGSLAFAWPTDFRPAVNFVAINGASEAMPNGRLASQSWGRCVSLARVRRPSLTETVGGRYSPC